MLTLEKPSVETRSMVNTVGPGHRKMLFELGRACGNDKPMKRGSVSANNNRRRTLRHTIIVNDGRGHKIRIPKGTQVVFFQDPSKAAGDEALCTIFAYEQDVQITIRQNWTYWVCRYSWMLAR